MNLLIVSRISSLKETWVWWSSWSHRWVSRMCGGWSELLFGSAYGVSIIEIVFWRKSLSLQAHSQMTPNWAQQIGCGPWRTAINYKKIKESTVLSSSQITRSISERCQWLVHLRQHLPTTWEGTPQHPITALSTVWVVRVSITSVLPGRTKAFTRTS